MKLIIDIHERDYQSMKNGHVPFSVLHSIMNGTPLPNVLSELQRELFMNVDGGTDDRYVRYVDVCDRIKKTIREFVEVQNEDSN